METQAIARRFFDRFGLTDELKVADFDLFIIDTGLATDPETDDTSDPRYMKFVQERTHARNRINSGGRWMNGNCFSVEIEQPGIMYSVKKWTDSSVEHAKEIYDRVKEYALNRQLLVTKDTAIARELLTENPHDDELIEAAGMLGMLDVEAHNLQNRIRGMINQYQIASEKVHEKVLKLQNDYTQAQLEAPEVE